MTDMSFAYVERHAPNLQTHQLLLALSKLGTSIAEAVAPELHVVPADLTHGMQQAIEYRIYRAVLKKADKDFVAGSAKWPTLRRTGTDDHALKDTSVTWDTMRSDALQSLYKRWSFRTGCPHPIYHENSYMHWLGDVQEVCKCALLKNDNEPKRKNSVRMTMRALGDLCNILDRADLEQKYRKLLIAELDKLDATPSKSQHRAPRDLTDKQIKALYDEIFVLFSCAMTLTSDTAITNYLLLALLWGDAPGLLQPARNDQRTIRFADPDSTTRPGPNFIELGTDGGVRTAQLVLSQRNKVGDKYREPIDLSQNKRLVEFLHRYYPYACRMQDIKDPYLLVGKDNKPLTKSGLSSKHNYMWKKVLEPKLGFYASGCNIARRCAVQHVRRAHGKRRMTDEERTEERELARQRGHTVATAEKYY